MAGKTRVMKQVPLADRIARRLALDIDAGAWPVGARLSSVRDLCARFDTSVRTVHLALSELESRGYVACHPRVGTVIMQAEPGFTAADSVVLCLETSGHVYGDVASRLFKGLHALGMLPVSADVGLAEGDQARQIIRRAASGGAPFFIVHGSAHFAFAELTTPAFRDKTIVGILDWCTNVLTDRVHRVVVDHAEGARIVARHLAAAGHRHVVVAGTETMLFDMKSERGMSGVQGREFARFWREGGGTLRPLRAMVPVEGDPSVAPEAFAAALSGPDAPTAIFGLMDAAAWACRKALLERWPERAAGIEIVGYGNTLWSRSAHPPFSSVDWRIDAIVKETLEIIRSVRQGDSGSPRLVALAPELIVR